LVLALANAYRHAVSVHAHQFPVTLLAAGQPQLELAAPLRFPEGELLAGAQSNASRSRGRSNARKCNDSFHSSSNGRSISASAGRQRFRRAGRTRCLQQPRSVAFQEIMPSASAPALPCSAGSISAEFALTRRPPRRALAESWAQRDEEIVARSLCRSKLDDLHRGQPQECVACKIAMPLSKIAGPRQLSSTRDRRRRLQTCSPSGRGDERAVSGTFHFDDDMICPSARRPRSWAAGSRACRWGSVAESAATNCGTCRSFETSSAG